MNQNWKKKSTESAFLLVLPFLNIIQINNFVSENWIALMVIRNHGLKLRLNWNLGTLDVFTHYLIFNKIKFWRLPIVAVADIGWFVYDYVDFSWLVEVGCVSMFWWGGYWTLRNISDRRWTDGIWKSFSFFFPLKMVFVKTWMDSFFFFTVNLDIVWVWIS